MQDLISFGQWFLQRGCWILQKNVDSRIVYGDITKIDSSEMPDDIDLVIGGFPCQGFSVANTKRSMKDERNFLYKEMLRVIDE